VGERTGYDAEVFMRGLASRLSNRVQLTTDGNKSYLNAVDTAFGSSIDHAMLHKIYESPEGAENERRYSPAVCIGIEVVQGESDMDKVSTSYVERQNLSMRMGMRRFTRLTNAFSKKVDNLAHAVWLHYMFYNFARPHATLTKNNGGKKTTPAMAAGVANRVWTHREIAALLD
jgi:hypothetical protein